MERVQRITKLAEFPISNRTAHDDMDRCFGLLEFLEPEDETGTIIVTACASSTHYSI